MAVAGENMAKRTSLEPNILGNKFSPYPRPSNHWPEPPPLINPFTEKSIIKTIILYTETQKKKKIVNKREKVLPG